MTLCSGAFLILTDLTLTYIVFFMYFDAVRC